MGAKEGKIDKWLKKRGEHFKSGETLCEVSLLDFTIGMSERTNGIITEILVSPNETVPANTPIASYTMSMSKYIEFIEEKMQESKEGEKLDYITHIQELKSAHPNNIALLREIKHLIASGKLDSQSELCQKLQMMALQNDPLVMTAFEASFDGSSYGPDSFDQDFFLSNIQILLNK